MPPNSFVLIGAGSTVFTPGLTTDAIAAHGSALDRFAVPGSAA